VSEHLIGVFGGLELGVRAEFVQHLVSGAQDFQIGQHDCLLGSHVRIVGVRDRIAGFALQPEHGPCASAGALAICIIPTTTVLSVARRAAVIPPVTELEQETIPSDTARP
jgi:hypothetical protein